MKILESFEINAVLNGFGGPVYCKSEKMKINRYSGFDDYTITDISNAMVRGKTCVQFSIKSETRTDKLPVTNWIDNTFNGDIVAVFKYCATLVYQQYQPARIDFDQLEIEIYKSEIPSKRVFSPFNLSVYRALKSMPQKWTLRHVYAALINGQFTDLKTNYRLSDDYAFDNAVNFFKDKPLNAISFVADIMESPSGWWCNYYNGAVTVCCHSFDSNEFIPSI